MTTTMRAYCTSLRRLPLCREAALTVNEIKVLLAAQKAGTVHPNMTIAEARAAVAKANA